MGEGGRGVKMKNKHRPPITIYEGNIEMGGRKHEWQMLWYRRSKKLMTHLAIYISSFEMFTEMLISQ